MAAVSRPSPGGGRKLTVLWESKKTKTKLETEAFPVFHGHFKTPKSGTLTRGELKEFISPSHHLIVALNHNELLPWFFPSEQLRHLTGGSEDAAGICLVYSHL